LCRLEDGVEVFAKLGDALFDLGERPAVNPDLWDTSIVLGDDPAGFHVASEKQTKNPSGSRLEF